MYYFAIGREAAENDILLFKLDHHVFHFPIDVPCLGNGQRQTSSHFSFQNLINSHYLHGIETPRFDMIARRYIHPHQPVEGNAQQFFLTLPHKLDNKERNSIVG